MNATVDAGREIPALTGMTGQSTSMTTDSLAPPEQPPEIHRTELDTSDQRPRRRWSVLAAITKSLRCKPRILCVHHATLTRPHSVVILG